jgi:pPIWI_RE module N-terminal domain
MGGIQGCRPAPAESPPWSTNERHTPRMFANFLIRDSADGAVRWRRGSLALLLPQLDIMRQYPSAAEVAVDPRLWLNGVGGVQAGVVYRYGLDNHEIETGIGPDERAELDRWGEDNLRPWFQRTPDMVRTGHVVKPALRDEKRLPREESKRNWTGGWHLADEPPSRMHSTAHRSRSTSAGRRSGPATTWSPPSAICWTCRPRTSGQVGQFTRLCRSRCSLKAGPVAVQRGPQSRSPLLQRRVGRGCRRGR